MKVNIADLEWVQTRNEGRFGARRKQLGRPAGGRMLGCSLFEVEKGKAAWPAHTHFGNEEGIYVLEGTGALRLGDEQFEVPAHHWVALPANTGRAHQLRNASDATLRYLCLSTMEAPDVVYRPDSDTVGVLCGSAPGDDSGRTLTAWLPASAAALYWHGEIAGVGAGKVRVEIGAAPRPERWPPIAGVADALVREGTHGTRIKIRGESLGRVAGSVKLGCTRFTCAAGHYSFPKHAHTANEEALFILEGTGASIAGETETPIRPGDYVVYPPDVSLAHHVRADADGDLVYLAFSTTRSPEVVHYPDSQKVGIMGAGPPTILDATATLGYFDREPDA